MEQEIRENPGAYFEANHQSGGYYEQAPSYPSSQTSASYLAEMERSINKQANMQTKAYLKEIGEENPADHFKEQIFLVFKFVNTPHDVLVSGLRAMEHHQLSQFYRKLAR